MCYNNFNLNGTLPLNGVLYLIWYFTFGLCIVLVFCTYSLVGIGTFRYFLLWSVKISVFWCSWLGICKIFSHILLYHRIHYNARTFSTKKQKKLKISNVQYFNITFLYNRCINRQKVNIVNGKLLNFSGRKLLSFNKC